MHGQQDTTVAHSWRHCVEAQRERNKTFVGSIFRFLWASRCGLLTLDIRRTGRWGKAELPEVTANCPPSTANLLPDWDISELVGYFWRHKTNFWIQPYKESDTKACGQIQVSFTNTQADSDRC